MEERDYLQEARSILDGTSTLLPERRHLDALDEYYQCQLILLASDAEALKRKALGM